MDVRKRGTIKKFTETTAIAITFTVMYKTWIS